MPRKKTVRTKISIVVRGYSAGFRVLEIVSRWIHSVTEERLSDRLDIARLRVERWDVREGSEKDPRVRLTMWSDGQDE